MTRKEEIEKEAIKQCTFKVKGIDSYVDTIDSTQYNGFIAGAQWADKTMIEKAVEWLEKNARNARDYVWHDEAMCGAGVTDKFINDFKKAMMEE